VLWHADRVDFVGNAEPLEQRHVHREQRFADVKARVASLFQHHHVAPAGREQRGDRRARGAAADHQHVASGFGH